MKQATTSIMSERQHLYVGRGMKSNTIDLTKLKTLTFGNGSFRFNNYGDRTLVMRSEAMYIV